MSAGSKIGRKQESAIAALLTAHTHAEAAAATGISESTLQRWLRLPEFVAAYRGARRAAVESAVAQLQLTSGEAVETLRRNLACGNPASEIRAALGIMDHALRGVTEADALHGGHEAGDASAMDTGEVVKLLAARLRQIDAAEMSTAEKARLTATLADAVLRAIGVDVLDKRLEALQLVLLGRKDKA
jgi:hypothetical protein